MDNYTLSFLFTLPFIFTYYLMIRYVYYLWKGKTMKKFIAIAVAIVIVVCVSMGTFMMNTVSDSDVNGVMEYRDDVMLVMTKDEEGWMTFTKYIHVIGDRYVDDGFAAFCGNGVTTANAFEFAWEAIS